MPKTEKQKEYMKQWRLNNQDKVKQYNKNAVQDYSQGKIYKIVCNITNEIYFGSTKEKYLSRRLSRHIDAIKEDRYMTSSEIIKRGNYYINLVETYPCKSKYELESRERYYIENFDCINKIVPTRTLKEYQKDNKELIAEKSKKRYDKNRDKILEKQKETYTCSCGITVNKNHKARHERGRNHLILLGKANEIKKYTCSCGVTLSVSSKKGHEKSQKHLNIINNILPIMEQQTCDICNCSFTKGNKFKIKHEKTQKHLNSLKQIVKK